MINLNRYIKIDLQLHQIWQTWRLTHTHHWFFHHLGGLWLRLSCGGSRSLSQPGQRKNQNGHLSPSQTIDPLGTVSSLHVVLCHNVPHFVSLEVASLQLSCHLEREAYRKGPQDVLQDPCRCQRWARIWWQMLSSGEHWMVDITLVRWHSPQPPLASIVNLHLLSFIFDDLNGIIYIACPDWRFIDHLMQGSLISARSLFLLCPWQSSYAMLGFDVEEDFSEAEYDCNLTG